MDRPDPVRRFFGALLMAVGALIASLSGLCSLVALCSMILNATQNTDYGTILPGLAGALSMMLLIGGIPFLLGLGLFVAGRAMRRP